MRYDRRPGISPLSRLVPQITMAERFYTNSSLFPGELILTGEAFRHLAIVCRGRPGTQVQLFNGDGFEYPATIQSVHKREVVLEVGEAVAVERELPIAIDVACAIPKGERIDLLVEKLTELGVRTLIPLLTTRSVVAPRPAKLERLRRIIVEASKQCGRNRLMQLAAPMTLAEVLSQHAPGFGRLIAHPYLVEGRSWRSLSEIPGETLASGVVLLVGPEGGFTDQEIVEMTEQGGQCIGLGSRILRVETAALVLAGWCTLHAERLRKSTGVETGWLS